jgi:hypothetical protein
LTFAATAKERTKQKVAFAAQNELDSARLTPTTNFGTHSNSERSDEGIRKDQIDVRYALACREMQTQKSMGIKSASHDKLIKHIGHNSTMSISQQKQTQVPNLSHKRMRSLLQMFCLVALLLLLSSLVTAQQKLTYIVQYSSEHSGRIHVQIAPASPIKSPVTLVIPRAIPSGYAQQFYDRYVDQIKATTSSETPAKKQDGPRWRVEQPGLTKIEYEVDVARLEQEIFDASAASKVRPEYVGLLGYSVLGYLEGFENLPVHLEVDAPQGWPVFTTLAPKVPCDTTKNTHRSQELL